MSSTRGTTAVPRFSSGSNVKADPKPLGEPLVFPFSKRTAQNRFLNVAMSERMASFDASDVASRGIPSEEMVRLYGRWGEGRWGQILTGNLMIHPEHLEAAGNLIVPPDAEFQGLRFDRFAALAREAKRHGSLMVAQVSHPGRQVPEDIQKHPISASAVQLVAPQMGATYGVPRAATREDIAGVIDGFVHAAEFLEQAGFDGIELHAAHGYLLAQFLSLRTNQRTDEYGGSLENRMRLILEIATAVKKRVRPEFIIGIKVNSVEFQVEKGFTPQEAVALCQALERAGFDYVEASGGTYECFDFRHMKESTRARENFFIEFAEEIGRALTTTPLYTTGGFKTVAGMVNALQYVDGVGIGRAAAQEPDLPKDILSGRIEGIMKYKLGEDDLTSRILFAVRQLNELGRGEEPVDLTDEEVVAKGPFPTKG
ncbi:hypothetical protein SLS62_007550 [Diatrype stigma]|uniref:NADH:flavin oxidoreductase/NADH oxidase N-terminal domain-containing protein n=1 Tax=Diatrype stigma TaxID=117547 RepID=A0AAN9YNA1_9PEZI